MLLRVTLGGGRSYDLALGESMTGVPATSSMHIRAGAFAFTYTSTLLMVLVDKGRVSLDDPLSRWYPDLPGAASITLRNLANMTSGYADYVFQPEVFDGIYRDPFRQWTNADLVRVGVTGPVMFEPGTNWGYSHTSYVILGDVLSQVAKMPLADALQRCEFKPMGLKDTTHSATPDIPEPVLHVFTSERRHALDIAPSIPFYEESTFWNPSWGTSEGAIDTTTMRDLTTTMRAVGTGRLVSPASSQAQIGPNLVGFGHP